MRKVASRIRWTSILRWVLPAVATWFIARTIRGGWGEIQASLSVFAPNDLWLIAAVVALETGWTLTLAQVYRSALGAFGGQAGRHDALRVSMGAFTLSRVLPGGGAVGALFAAREFIAIGNSAAVTLLSMVTGGWVSLASLSTLVTVSVGIGAALGLVAPGYLIIPAIVLGVLAGVGLFAMAALRIDRLRLRVAQLLGRLFGRWGGGMTAADIEEAMRRAAPVQVARLRPVGFWAASSWLLDSAALWLVFAALGHTLSLGALAVGYGLANLLQALPELVPGWLGVLEGTMAVAYAAFGVPGGVAAVAVLAYRVFSFWFPVAAGIPFGLDLLRRHRTPAAVLEPA